MNLHEYQAKALFRAYGVDTPRSILAKNADEAVAAAQELGGSVWVVKAQVHAGGRGKAGGVKVAKSLDEVRAHASQMIGNTLKTKQTGEVGLPINMVLIEEGLDIADELYVSAVVDRASRRVSFIASAEGGMDIEEVAEKSPEKIHSVGVDPSAGYFPYVGRRLGFAMGLDKKQVGQLATLLQGLYNLFTDKDLSMVEINPLIVTGDGKLLALDAMNDIRPNANGYADWKTMIFRGLNGLRHHVFDIDRDLVNRFVRSNELFYVVPVSDVHQEDSYQKIVQCG